MEQDGALAGLQHDRDLAVEDDAAAVLRQLPTASPMRRVRPSRLNFNPSLLPSLTSSSCGLVAQSSAWR